MELNFDREVKFQQKGQFLTYMGSLYNDASKKGHFSTLTSGSILLKNDPRSEFTFQR